MKKAEKILNRVLGILALLLLLVLTLVFLRSRKPCPPDGKVLVSQEFVDSLQAIANTPPDTVVVTRVEKSDSIVYVDINKPTELADTDDNISDPDLIHYRDSVVNDSVNVWVDYMTRGVAEEMTISYKPTVQIKEMTITKHVPYPVIERVEVPVNYRGLLAHGGVGFMYEKPIVSVGAMWINGGNLSYGAEYLMSPGHWGVIFRGGYKFNYKHR